MSVRSNQGSTKSQGISWSHQYSLCFGGHTHSVTEHKSHTVQPKVCAQLQPTTAVPTAASTFVVPAQALPKAALTCRLIESPNGMHSQSHPPPFLHVGAWCVFALLRLPRTIGVDGSAPTHPPTQLASPWLAIQHVGNSPFQSHQRLQRGRDPICAADGTATQERTTSRAGRHSERTVRAPVWVVVGHSCGGPGRVSDPALEAMGARVCVCVFARVCVTAGVFVRVCVWLRGNI
jgi:hypothetical protein